MTKLAFWSSIAACALGLFSVACGGGKSCEELCVAADACPDVQPADKTCKVRCDEQSKILEASKCQEKQEDYDLCVSGLKDACNSSTECSTEAIARNVCVDAYCSANPKVAGCSAP